MTEEKLHGENCCCHDHDECCEDEEMDVIVLTLDDDTEIECAIIEIFPVEDKEYIALLTLDDEEKVLLYEYAESDDEDDIQLSMIESEEEFEKVSEEFNRIMDEEDECECEE